MSTTKIPDKTVVQLWKDAGGRCEFRGCNEALWRDDLTLAKMNAACIAHIVADSPGGPRGDPVLSPKLAREISNLMLLCGKHHALIDDREHADSYPVELLQEYKCSHERRIEFLTGLDEQLKTHVVTFLSCIADRRPSIAIKEAHRAILPRYPATEQPVEFDVTDSPYRDHERGYFARAQDDISRRVDRQLRQRGSRDQIEHLSIFGLASIPLLIHFGHEVGETIPSDVYGFHRNTNSWAWQPFTSEQQLCSVDEPSVNRDQPPTCQVVLNVSLSDSISEVAIQAVTQAIGLGACPVYTIGVPNRVPDQMRSKDQLDQFVATMRQLALRIRANHGLRCEIHLFPAMPAPAAIRLGQIWNPKCFPTLHVYEYNQQHGDFTYALTVPRPSA